MGFHVLNIWNLYVLSSNKVIAWELITIDRNKNEQRNASYSFVILATTLLEKEQANYEI